MYKQWDSFFSWLSLNLASIYTDLKSHNRNWQVLLFASSQGVELFTRKSDKITSEGLIKSDSDLDEIGKLKRILNKKTNSTTSEIVLRLSKDHILSKDLQLPKAARDVIEPILKNHMQKYVPWPEDDIRFGYVVGDTEEKNSEQINVTFYATSQKLIDDVLSIASQINVRPQLIEFGEKADSQPGIPFTSYDAERSERVASYIRRYVILFLGLCLSLSAVGFYLLYDSINQKSDVEQKISKAQNTVAELRQSNLQARKNYKQKVQLITNKKQRYPVISVIEQLSAALPDNAFLTRLEITDFQIYIYGEASDAASLINILEKIPSFEKVQFSAPTVKKGNKEEFSITAKITRSPKDTLVR